ncbi:MAG TPA: AmmeMemoRadiSam system radical SAM enzyme, partial [bacterium]|nr:AmmeMemoRadiSam system radical SAM enzyme [bacterium]
CHGEGTAADTLAVTHEQTFVQCQLCAQRCVIQEGERGKCQTRMNVDGELKTLVYGRPISTHIDPIEKKPLYHFLPGSSAFSMATAGCPLSCKFCQNWQISQARPEDYRTEYISPEQVVRATVSREVPVIAFTYNEPTVFTEYLIDIARRGKRKGIRSVVISCGFMNAEPLAEMCEVLDAIKIDLKGFSQDFYTKVCDARLQPVLDSIRQIAKTDTHLELVNLVVPTLNDSDRMLTDLVEWVYNEAGPDVPIHFTRFHPDYKLRNLPPTPIATLERARSIALDRGLRYPFVGNVPGHPGNHTYCPACGKIVIERSGFFIQSFHIQQGRCEYCNESIAGVWS